MNQIIGRHVTNVQVRPIAVVKTQPAVASCHTRVSQKVNAVHTSVARRAGVALQLT
jgi:hypothetical protein